MRQYLFIAVIPLCLSGCLTTQQTQNILTIACAASDAAPGLVQTGGVIATIVDPASVAAVASVNAAEQAIHPKVQAACAKALANSVPVPGTVSQTTAPVAPQTAIIPTLAIIPTTPAVPLAPLAAPAQ